MLIFRDNWKAYLKLGGVQSGWTVLPVFPEKKNSIKLKQKLQAKVTSKSSMSN